MPPLVEVLLFKARVAHEGGNRDFCGAMFLGGWLVHNIPFATGACIEASIRVIEPKTVRTCMPDIGIRKLTFILALFVKVAAIFM